MSKVESKIRSNPAAFIRISAASPNGDKKFMLVLLVLFCLFLFSKSKNGFDLWLSLL